MFKLVKRYYEKGYYTIDNVRIFVSAGKITEEEFKDITGVDYIEPQEPIDQDEAAELVEEDD